MRNLSRSVHDRLLSQAKTLQRPFIERLQHFAIERFLYRLSKSDVANRFVLKGGVLLRAWNVPIERPTRDIDLLAFTPNEADVISQSMASVCEAPAVPDGLVFDATTIVTAPTREDSEYGGLRVKLLGSLGSARAPMQIDVGFGDDVVPGPATVELPTLLDFPSATVRAYQRETVIAEKLHALVVLGSLNGRMKDFFDLWLLANSFEFEGRVLAAAIEATFRRRTTEIEVAPTGLSEEFAMSDLAQSRWAAFVRRSDLLGVPDLGDAIALIREFASPFLSGGRAGRWPPGGPWH